MATILDFLRYHPFTVWFRLSLYSLGENIRLARHLASSGNRKQQPKFEADLTIRIHAIEKGLALPRPRVGFGEAKVNELLTLLKTYFSRFGDSPTLASGLAVLRHYFEFQASRQHACPQLEARYQALVDIIGKAVGGTGEKPAEGGVITLSRHDIQAKAGIAFADFAASRYSVRDFSDEKVGKASLLRALEIARKTPSACNRQSWRVYLFRGRPKNALLEWQGGNRGFTEAIDTAILITSDLHQFFLNERHQAYVDGGLYAMSLLYALHAEGLGTIPLTTGKKDKEVNRLYTDFHIPPHEVPILIIGVGCLKETFRVALSARKDIHTYTRFIDDEQY